MAEELWIHVCRPGVSYGYKGFVLPQYRGIALHYTNTHYCNRYFFENGVHENFSGVALHNLASRRNASRDPDRQHFGYVGFLRIGGRYWTFRTGRARSYLELEVRQ